MNWIKKNWTDMFLFVWASLWTAGGIYLAVNTAVDNQNFNTWSQFFELLIFLNISAFVVYSGLKTQLGLIKEFKDKK